MSKNHVDGLFLSGDIFSAGGIQTYSRHLFGAMESVFKEIDSIAVILNDTLSAESMKWNNIRLVFCGQIKFPFIRKVLFALKFISLAAIHRPKLIICCHVHLAPLAFFIRRFLGIRYAVIVHGSDVWDLKRGSRFSALKNSALIISVSNYTKGMMVKNGIPQEKIKVLPPAVDTLLFQPLPPNRDLLKRLTLEGKRVILIVSRLDSRERLKGHDVMLKVMQRLPDTFVLLIVGSGDDLKRLKDMALQLGVSDKVRFFPVVTVTGMADIYNLCNMFVMPSKQEGFGIVFLEAMACGKPVIGGDKDASVEPLMGGKLGFLVNPDDPEEIIKAINSASTVKEERTSSEYLRKQVEDNFGIGVFNKRTKEVLAGYLP